MSLIEIPNTSKSYFFELLIQKYFNAHHTTKNDEFSIDIQTVNIVNKIYYIVQSKYTLYIRNITL
jgi:hypothetical protein